MEEVCSEEAKVQKGASAEIEDDHNYYGGSKEAHQDLECQECGVKFAYRHNLLKHLRSIHSITAGLNKRNFPCFLCEAIMKSKSDYLSHLEMAHNVAVKNVSNCKECAVSFSTPEALRKHCKENHPSKIAKLTQHYKCCQCGEVFTQCSEIMVHLKTVHNSTDVAGSVNNSCPECGKRFSNVSSIGRHLRTIHKKITKVPQAEGTIKPKKKVICKYCDRLFATKSSLNLHLEKIHNEKYTVQKSPSPCGLCPMHFERFSLLVQHYESAHDVTVEEENLKFSSESEFLDWKMETEKNTTSQYVKISGSVIGKGFTATSYHCHRSGHYISKGNNKRNMKSGGSNKIGIKCLSRMRAKKLNTGAVHVMWIKTHVGHSLEVQRLRLTKGERADIAVKLANNVPFDKILNEVTSSSSPSGLNRIHLLKRRDLLNIEKTLNIKSADTKRHPSDVSSLDSWVSEMCESSLSPVLYYKTRGLVDPHLPGLLEDDILLVVINDIQLDLLMNFKDGIVCIDSTHGLSIYDLHLTTLLIIDNMEEAYPVMLIVSNKVCEVTISISLELLKRYHDVHVSPKIFMSGMDEMFYNGWKAVYGECEHRLWCTWQVDHVWKSNLKFVNDQNSKKSTLKLLHSLLLENDEEVFLKQCEDVCKQLLASPATEAFGRYFMEQFANNLHMWASCYRLFLGTNNNKLEKVQKKIRHHYYQGKKSKCIEKGIEAILVLVGNREATSNGAITTSVGSNLTTDPIAVDEQHTSTFHVPSTDTVWVVKSSDNTGSFFTMRTYDQACAIDSNIVDGITDDLADKVVDELSDEVGYTVGVGASDSQITAETLQFPPTLQFTADAAVVTPLATPVDALVQQNQGSERLREQCEEKIAELSTIVENCDDENKLSVLYDALCQAFSTGKSLSIP